MTLQCKLTILHNVSCINANASGHVHRRWQQCPRRQFHRIRPHAFQKQMKGETEKEGLLTEDDVNEWIIQSRREKSAE